MKPWKLISSFGYRKNARLVRALNGGHIIMKTKLSKIMSRLVMAALGVLLIANPSTALQSLIRFIGIAIAVIGVFGIISYIAAPYRGFIATAIFAGSIIAVLLSIIPIAKPAVIVAIFPLIIGISIAVNGIVGAFEAVSLRPALGYWFVPLLLSLLAAAAGLVIAFYPFSTMDLLVRIVGVILVYSAVVGLFMTVTYKPPVNKRPPKKGDVVDITDIN